MTSDDSDKTVFKKPQAGGDFTTMKPMPGGRSLSRASPPNSAEQDVTVTATASHRPSPGLSQRADGGAAFRTQSGLNLLVNAASTLIAVFEKTRHSASHSDIGGLHQRLSGEIRAFENRVREVGYSQEVLLSARYFICATLDESVLNTPWGSESPWAQRTLLSVFHNETSGGEKCFLILDRMRQAPADNLDILELIYICLSLGFEGKYRLQSRGSDALDRIKDDLFTLIYRQRGEYEHTLSRAWRGLGRVSNSLANYVPTWVVASIVAALLFFSYSGFRYWLYQSATPVVDQFAEFTVSKEEK